MDQFSRTRLLLGEEAMERLSGSRVAVFGIGGVGGAACEALARSGVGALDLIDHDRISLTNLNRQVIATLQTVGQYKAEAMRDRILSINPSARVQLWKTFVLPENIGEFPFGEYDYVVDALDTMAAKLIIAETGQRLGVRVISSMGTGNKLDPGRLRISDIYETSVCPLARTMRQELRKRGIPSLKVVWSDEMPLPPQSPPGEEEEIKGRNRPVPGSVSFVPPVAGMMLAGEVIRELAGPLKRDGKEGKE